MCLDIGKEGKKKICEFYLSIVCLRRENKNTDFYLCALINHVNIHILETIYNFLKMLTAN